MKMFWGWNAMFQPQTVIGYMPFKNLYKESDFKACDARKSGAYIAYVSILKASVTPKSPF